MIKKFISALLPACIILSCIPVFAAEPDTAPAADEAYAETVPPDDGAAAQEIPLAEGGAETEEIPLAEATPDIRELDGGETEAVSEVPAEQPAAAPDNVITSYTVNFTCQLDGWPRKDYGVFNIYSESGELLGSHTKYIEDTESFSLTYDLPAAPVGTVYYLEITGADSVDYYTENYTLPLKERLPLYTYVTEPDENGAVEVVSSAEMNLHVRTQGIINIYADGKYTALSSPAIFEDESIIAPLSEVAEAIGITDCTFFPKYNSVKVKTGDNEMLVNIGYSYITVFGEDKALNVPVSNINSLTYIELRPFVESFGCTLEYYDSGEYIDILINKSPLALESIAALEQRINDSGIGSSTGYLIWVNKQKFRCAVFEGYSGNWKWIKDFTVGIGAPDSETITGAFEYSAAQDRWTYEHYYVGPIMVFYGNYALHSTLLNYDGTPYNNNVGVKLSLGCVRCQPKYINWMSANIPLGTRVYVTEN